jgi:hypothetical protein
MIKTMTPVKQNLTKHENLANNIKYKLQRYYQSFLAFNDILNKRNNVDYNLRM